MEYDLEVMINDNYLGVEIANTGMEEYEIQGKSNIIIVIYYIIYYCILRRIYGGKEVKGIWRRKANENLMEQYGDPSIISMARTQKLKWLDG